MSAVEIAVLIDQELLDQLDELVQRQQFSNRSQAVQDALRDKLQRMRKSRLALECAKLDPRDEQALAEEGLTEDSATWPDY